MDISQGHLYPEANQAVGGQQSGCLADLDGDGAQDLTLALNNGEIWVFFRDNKDHNAFMAVADLPIADASAATNSAFVVNFWRQQITTKACDCLTKAK